MSYSVNWTTKVVTVPLTDLTLVSGSNYTLDTGDFWIEMRRLEASPTDGLWTEQVIEYVNTQLLSGITYSAIVKMINGYTWDTDTTNKNISLLGYNSNLLDTFIPGSGISVLANNSAGKIETGSGMSAAQDLKISEIHGLVRRCVWVDTEELSNGDGYQQTPFNNWSDAVDYNEANGLTSMFLKADAVVDRQLKNFEIFGVGLPAIDMNGQILTGSTFRLCNLTGTQGGGSVIAFDCRLSNVTDFNGAGSLIGAVGSIAFANGGTSILNEIVHFEGESATLSLTAGGVLPTKVEIQNASGEFEVTDMDLAGDEIHIAIKQGQITIDASCSAGTINLYGAAELVDNSTGTTVNKAGFIETKYVNKKLLTKSYFTALS